MSSELLRTNPIYRFGQRSFRRVYPHLVWDRTPDDKVVVVVGKGRSGTTWLADLINCRKDHRYLFEPFNLSKRFQGHPLCSGPDENRGYTRPADRSVERLRIAQTILTGRSGDSGPESRNRRPIFRRRLIKEITCTLYLAWMIRQFPGYRYLLLVRNPFATAASQARHNWSRATATDYEADETLIEDHLAKHMSFIAEYDQASPFERAVLSWAIAFWVLRRQAIGNQCLVVGCERLAHNPECLRDIFAYLGRDDHPQASHFWCKPSATAWTGIAASGSSFNGGVTTQQVRQARRILDRFGMADIYFESGEPQDDDWLTMPCRERAFADVV